MDWGAVIALIRMRKPTFLDILTAPGLGNFNIVRYDVNNNDRQPRIAENFAPQAKNQE